ncbi:MAG: hypothetical protein KDJ52_36925, partial [Anaerolineae bacterium]|nr:hypothetical protein [Anaerolineae bacterium]
RAFGCGPKGRRFESYRGRLKKNRYSLFWDFLKIDFLIKGAVAAQLVLGRGTSRLSASISEARSPHETVSEGKALKSVFDYNRNRKQVSLKGDE